MFLAGLLIALSGCGSRQVPHEEEPVEQPVSRNVDAGETKHVPDVELDEAKQDAIWLAEHVTFEFEQRFGKRFLDAWITHSLSGMAEMCFPEFQGAVRLGMPQEILHAGIRQVTQPAVSETSAREELGVDGFAHRLCEPIAGLGEHRSRTFRVLSIQQESEQPTHWRVRILLGTTGLTPEGTWGEFSSEHTALLVADPDQSDWKEELLHEPVIREWTIESTEFRERAEPLFVEATADYRLDRIDIDDNWNLEPAQALQYRFQMAVDDYDRDGWLDIAIAEQHRSRLLRYRPDVSRFVDVTGTMGIVPLHVLKGRPIDLAGWIDYDNDGYPDLLLGNRLYHNDEGRGFTDVTGQSGLTFKLQAMGVLVADFNADGLLDLYILYQASEETPQPATNLRWIEEDDYGEENHLWLNLGNGRFRNVTRESNAGGGLRHTLAGTWFHYDDDHFPDLYIANDLSTNVLLRNRGDGTFEDVSFRSGSSDFATSMGVAAGDTDNDGTADLYVANMFSKMGRRIIGHVSEDDYPPGIFEQIQGSCAGNRLYLRTDDPHRFQEFGEQFGIHGVGWAYAPAMADFDGDGWLDLYATTGFLSFERGKPDG